MYDGSSSVLQNHLKDSSCRGWAEVFLLCEIKLLTSARGIVYQQWEMKGVLLQRGSHERSYRTFNS